MKTIHGTTAHHPCNTTEEPCEFERLHESASLRAATLRARNKELLEAVNKAIAYLANPQAFDAEGLGHDWFQLVRKAKGEL